MFSTSGMETIFNRNKSGPFMLRTHNYINYAMHVL